MGSRRFKHYDRDAVRKILDSPSASLALKVKLADAAENFGDPRGIAQAIVDHLGDAQRGFQAVLDSLR
ncbi:hypothetical protein ABZZ46_12775 [Streptomyces rochei]|uniref:hypothetical protein n=1 Tax=Streptomyces rochei TaxID=1928 RepID=UPI0033A3D752